jgi:hypothetical protein
MKYSNPLGNIKDVQTSRRRVLGGAISAACVATLYAAAVLRPAKARPGKISQKLVDYQDTAIGVQMCSGCELFVPPNCCKLVEGTISPNGYCISRIPLHNTAS